MKTRPCRPAFLSVIVGTLVLALASGGLAQTRPLKILLTNDDGFDSSGLTVMRTALVKAGHHVTVVAPGTNMSASSMSTTSGVIKIERKGETDRPVDVDTRRELAAAAPRGPPRCRARAGTLQEVGTPE